MRNKPLVYGQNNFHPDSLVQRLTVVTQALGVDPYTAGFADMLNETYAAIENTESQGMDISATGP